MKKAFIILFVAVVSVAFGQEKTNSFGFSTSCKIVVPNAFTPNGDGVNDAFFVSVADDCTPLQYEIRVFDRWGRLVFESNKTDDRWDGTYDGQELKEGVYLWQISVTWPNENSTQANIPETKKGSLVLIR